MFANVIHKLFSYFNFDEKVKKSHRPNKIALQNKIEMDIYIGNINKAVLRLEGAIRGNLLNTEYSYRLAELYIQNKDFIKAGRHFYLKECKTETEKYAVLMFEKSLGRDPTLILKKIINKQFFKLSNLNDYQLSQLVNLLEKSKIKEKKTSKFLLTLDEFSQRNKSKITQDLD